MEAKPARATKRREIARRAKSTKRAKTGQGERRKSPKIATLIARLAETTGNRYYEGYANSATCLRDLHRRFSANRYDR